MSPPQRGSEVSLPTGEAELQLELRCAGSLRLTAIGFPYTLCMETMPRYLTEQDIADFRAELCRVATERFARFGYEGVTMRQLAEALGCSPKTPYRYFKDKADILATVRAQAFAKFADALEAAPPAPPTTRSSAGARIGEAYLPFALKNSHAYRIMFEIDAPIDDSHPDLGPQAERAAPLHHPQRRGDWSRPA